MIRFLPVSHDFAPWREQDGVHIRGGTGSVPALPPSPSGDELRSCAGAGDGASIVRQREDELLAVVDEGRAFPLFFHESRDHGILLSDDPRRLARETNDRSRDEETVPEALASGFVIGRRTLLRGVRQLRPGDILRARTGPNGPTLSIDEAAPPPLSTRDNDPDRRARMEELGEIWERVTRRLVRNLDGRPAILPLTGGFDSRLLAILLREARYEPILCLGSYRAHHWEATIARDVADRLGHRWRHFGAEPNQWKIWYRSAERRRFTRHADGAGACPSLLEWPALYELRKSGEVPPTAVIVSGHFGDAVSGSVLPAHPVSGSDPVEAALSHLLEHRYVLNPLPADARDVLRRRLRGSLERLLPGARDGEDLIERWETREFQPKMIGNARRTYEFFGLEWTFPYRDPELIDFWRRVPRRDRRGAALHRAYVRRRASAWDLPPANPGVIPLHRRPWRRWLRAFRLLSAARTARRMVRRLDGRRLNRFHGVGWHQIFPDDEVRRTYTGLEGVESYLVRDWLDHVTEDVV